MFVENVHDDVGANNGSVVIENAEDEDEEMELEQPAQKKTKQL